MRCRAYEECDRPLEGSVVVDVGNATVDGDGNRKIEDRAVVDRILVVSCGLRSF
jgi:hypothetical protein